MKRYEAPELEIAKIEASDVFTESGGNSFDTKPEDEDPA